MNFPLYLLSMSTLGGIAGAVVAACLVGRITPLLAVLGMASCAVLGVLFSQLWLARRR